MINVRDIHTYYGESYILQGVSLALERGKVVGLLGRNGVGKSTLVRSIMGMTPPRRGTISLDDRDMTKLATQSIVKLGVGMVPQERRIFKSLTVEENLTINERGNGNLKWTLDRV